VQAWPPEASPALGASWPALPTASAQTVVTKQRLKEFRDQHTSMVEALVKPAGNDLGGLTVHYRAPDAAAALLCMVYQIKSQASLASFDTIRAVVQALPGAVAAQAVDALVGHIVHEETEAAGWATRVGQMLHDLVWKDAVVPLPQLVLAMTSAPRHTAALLPRLFADPAAAAGADPTVVGLAIGIAIEGSRPDIGVQIVQTHRAALAAQDQACAAAWRLLAHYDAYPMLNRELRRAVAEAAGAAPGDGGDIYARIAALAACFDEGRLDVVLATLLGEHDGARAVGHAIAEARAVHGPACNAAGALVAALPQAALDTVLQAAVDAQRHAPRNVGVGVGSPAPRHDVLQSSADAVLGVAHAALMHAGPRAAPAVHALLHKHPGSEHAIRVCAPALGKPAPLL
jgi:hypothetical protein